MAAIVWALKVPFLSGRLAIFLATKIASDCDSQERKISPKRKFLGRISRGHPGVHSRGYPGPKLRSGHSKSWKNKHLGADIHDPKARTSTTPRDFQKLRSEKLWAEFSFPVLAQSRLFYREMDCPVRFHREMDCPVQWSLATPSALESQSRANQGSVVANPICKCRRHKADHLQVRVAVGKRSTCVLKEAPLNKGPLGLPQIIFLSEALSPIAPNRVAP